LFISSMFIYSNGKSKNKKEKEVGMKKIFIVMLAIFLAVPAISYAGSATSRFDMTIGGMLNLNFGYFSKDMNENTLFGPRDSSGTRKNLYSEYGNTYFSPADSNVNFLVRGPDAWGAKVSGLLQLDFRGTNTGNNFGGAQMQQAWLRMNWPNSELLIGQTFGQFGATYQRDFVIANDFGPGDPISGARPMQIAFRTNIAKQFSAMMGVMMATQWSGSGAGGAAGPRQYNDGYGRSGLPVGMAEIAYKSEACGIIGPNMMQFGLGGMAGKEKKVNEYATAGNNYITDDTVNVWMLALRGFIPIIPEKKGNKTGAFYFTTTNWIGQNLGGGPWVGPGISNGSYWRGAATATGSATDAVAPTAYGGYWQLSYYINNTTKINAIYSLLKYNYSSFGRTATPLGSNGNDVDYKGVNMVNSVRGYGLSIFHDPSANLRFGFQWQRLFTNYNGVATPANSATAYTTGTGNLLASGEVDLFRVMAAYFF
jgi:hypothetical protein